MSENSTAKESPFRPRTAQNAIAAELRRRILSGELAPGTQLRQGEIAQMLDVSITPVREAMRELASELLVDSDPHRGMFVHAPSSEEFAEANAIMHPLEHLAVRAAAQHITAEEIADAEAILDAMDNATGHRWVQLNVEFHHVILHASRMPLLEASLSRLRNFSSLYVAAALVTTARVIERGRDEHRQLLELLRAGDADGAAACATAHLDASQPH